MSPATRSWPLREERTRDLDEAHHGGLIKDVLHSGQYTKVKLQLQRTEPTLWLPTTSVVQAQSGIFILKNANNLIKRIPVQTGVSKGSLIEVFGNLQNGDKILLKGLRKLKRA